MSSLCDLSTQRQERSLGHARDGTSQQQTQYVSALLSICLLIYCAYYDTADEAITGLPIASSRSRSR